MDELSILWIRNDQKYLYVIEFINWFPPIFSASSNAHVTSEIIRKWEPFFVEQVPNITVAAGKDATLHCQVDNLHGYKVVNSNHTILQWRDT